MINLDRNIKNNYIDSSFRMIAKQAVLNSDVLNPSNYITKDIYSNENLINFMMNRELNTSLSHKVGKPFRFVAKHISLHVAQAFYSLAGTAYHGIHTGYFSGKIIYNICTSKNYSEEIDLVKKQPEILLLI